MMTPKNLKTKSTKQLLRWTRFHNGRKLDMLMDELCDRLDPEVYDDLKNRY